MECNNILKGDENKDHSGKRMITNRRKIIYCFGGENKYYVEAKQILPRPNFKKHARTKTRSAQNSIA